jgi:threonine aldolase
LFPIDLKSDTITRPGAEMRRAMCEAEVGDDVYGEDPTVRRLEKMGAELLGQEAALYVTSGTQGNLVSLLTHCNRGDGVLVGQEAHMLQYEGGGLAALGGAVPIPMNDEKGLPDIADLERVMKPKGNVHFAYPRLLCLENTHNRAGGHASTPEEISERATWAHDRGLFVHLDGARLFNATVALGVKAADMVKDVDSIQICLSKGLGAPMGSLICASGDFIERARYWRKKVGGGLRQAGIVAAAGIYAFEHNVTRLAEDHENARSMKEILRKGGLRVGDVRRPTNMVYFGTPDEQSADRLLEACRRRQVIFNKTAPDTFRLVTHLNVSREQAIQAAEIIAEEFQNRQ